MHTRTFTRAELCELSRHLHATRAIRPPARPPVRDDQADVPELDDDMQHALQRDMELRAAEELRAVVIGVLCAGAVTLLLSVTWWLVR